MALRLLLLTALTLAATAAPAATSPAPTVLPHRRRLDLKNFHPFRTFRQSRDAAKSAGSPFAAIFSAAPDAPRLAYHPSNLLPHGVMYDPVIGFSHERVQVRDWPDGPIRIAEEEVDIRAVLRKMKTHVPGDLLDARMPVLSHQVYMLDEATARQATDVVTISGSKSSYKLVLDSNMPEESRKAFERAITTWSETFPSPVEIRIRFSWTDLGGETLGATSVAFYIQGSTDGADKLDDNTVYGSAMAGALQGIDFVPESEMHVVMGFNSSMFVVAFSLVEKLHERLN
jgi:hypothetical protein